MKQSLLVFTLIVFITATTWLAGSVGEKSGLNRLTSLVGIVHADEVDDLQKQIDDLEHLKGLSEAATAPLEGQVMDLDKRITSARAGMKSAQQGAAALAADINVREDELGNYYNLFKTRVHSEYLQLRRQSLLDFFLQTKIAKTVFQQLAYHEMIRNQNQALIEDVETRIVQLEIDKKALEERQVRLAAMEKQLDTQAEFFKGEIAKAKAYQKDLTGKIAELSTRQRAILDARSGSTITSVGEVPLADDFNASIGYKSQAPGNSFAVFSFGGYTHRNGMSQYGAKARADAGQSVEEILQAYYPGSTLKKDFSEMGSISVQGTGTISFEDQYLQGIYEMPGSWHINALKAQAIAARTYAIRYTGNGSKSICTTEACQVFKNSKKGGDWEKAVNETKNWVLVDGTGNPVSTQYASTHGGYARTSGWDTTDKSGGGDWSTRAWESKAGSPWFYKAWYRAGYSSSGNGCGRSHPWLSQEEFSDVINGWIVRKNPNGADADRVLPLGGCSGGGDPYSMEELRNAANNSGGAVTSVSSVSVSHNDSGQTSGVNLQTNRGTISMSGDEFKTAFNLRAPGNIRIPQTSFAFFNIEHKQ
jgi:peptidoglycan hydrolase-like amidase